MKNILYIIYLSIFILLTSCGGDVDTPSADGFDRGDLLENATENIIIPTHNNLLSTLTNLQNRFNDFSSNINSDNLSQLRSAWYSSYKAWQYVEMFNIGKAEEIYYSLKMNSYPTNASRIETNLLLPVENIDLDYQDNNLSSQGFPALDYLLYGIANDSTQVLSVYKSENGIKYINYMQLLIQNMISNTNLVISYWNTNKDDFINSTGNTATSSLNMLTNDFIYYYEKGLRANKIGIPAGVWASVLTDRVEAYYRRGVSKELALEALDASKSFFMGKNFITGTQGSSLSAYLNYINTDNNLSEQIINIFDNAISEVGLLDNNFVHQLETNHVDMLYAYDAVQAGVVKLKTDMLSLLSIDVDYFDADGD